MPTRNTIVISGGCGGVGRAAGNALASAGNDIIALYRSTPEEQAKVIVDEFPAGNHEAIRCDIRNGDEVAATMEYIRTSRGSIGGCVHAAVDSIIRKNMFELTAGEFESQLATAVMGGFNFLTTMGAMMSSSGGVMVGILSAYVSTKAPHSRLAGYVIAKYALRGMLKELALELAPAHISVNAIAPDFLDTKLNADLPESVRGFIKDKMSVGSIRTTDDVGRAIEFLFSEEGKKIHGMIYSPDVKEMHNL